MLPGKSFRNSLSDEFLEKRKVELNRYLQVNILNLNKLYGSVTQFFFYKISKKLIFFGHWL
jgi:hypothetical protein